MSVTKQFMGPIEVNGVHQLSGYRHSSTYIILCSAQLLQWISAIIVFL